VQEIKHRGDATHRDLDRLRDESAQVKAQYEISLQQKKDIEGRIEEVLKNNEGVEARALKDYRKRRKQKLWCRRRKPLSKIYTSKYQKFPWS
jgi:hypothetical protein